MGRVVTDTEVATFKKGWHEADEAGLDGQRVALGLARVMELLGRSPSEVLDDLEDRIKNQREAAEFPGMAWRAHTADLMHLGEVRKTVDGS